MEIIAISPFGILNSFCLSSFIFYWNIIPFPLTKIIGASTTVKFHVSYLSFSEQFHKHLMLGCRSSHEELKD